MTDDPNPYAAPQLQAVSVTPLSDAEAEAERVRRLYLNHEASVQSIGSLYYFSGFLLLVSLALGVARVATWSAIRQTPLVVLVPLGICGGLGALALILARGLRSLNPQARFPAVITSALAILSSGFFILEANPVVAVIGIAINAYIAYLLLCPKGTMVFSAYYADIRRQTPHIRYRSPWLVRIVGTVFLVIIGLGVLGAVVAALRFR
jgi:hypothetical protein